METEESFQVLVGERTLIGRSARTVPKPSSVTIVIPVLRDFLGLAATLESLRRAGVFNRTDFGVLVVSDVGDAQVSDVCASFPVSMVLGNAAGSYAARNIGVTHSESEFVAFLDADVEIASGWPGAVQHAIAMGLDYAGGEILLVGNEACSRLHNLFLRIYEFPNGLFFEKYGFFPTANLLVRREVLERAGGFESRVRSGGDLELGRRLAADLTLSRGMMAEMTVYHPTRSAQQYFRKVGRQASGHHVLGVLFPEAFPDYRCSATLRHCVRLLIGWRDFRERVTRYQRQAGESLGWRDRVGVFLESRVAHLVYAWARLRLCVANYTGGRKLACSIAPPHQSRS